MRWIRLEASWDESKWVDGLSPLAQLAWIKFMCKVKRDGTRGTLKPIDPEVSGRRWKVTTEAVQEMLDAAVADGALVVTADEMRLSNWLKYNPLDPNATARKRRERNRNTSHTVTDGHDMSRCDIVTSVARDSDSDIDKKENKRGFSEGEDVEAMFADLWSLYPRRAGTNSRADAFRQFRSRLREGEAYATIREGVVRYARYCEATGKVKTELVMAAERFLGRGKHYREEFDIPAAAPAPGGSWSAEAEAAWTVIRDNGLHHLTNRTQAESQVKQLAQAGEIADARMLLELLLTLDRGVLQDAKNDREAIAHVADKLARYRAKAAA